MTVPPSYKKNRTGVSFRDEAPEGPSAFFVNVDEDQTSDGSPLSGIVRRKRGVPSSVLVDPYRGVFIGFDSASDAPAISTVAPTIRATRTSTSTSCSSPTETEVGDLMIFFLWTRTGATPTEHTIQEGWTQILTQLHDDTGKGRISVAYMVATQAGAVSYTAFSNSVGGGGQGSTIMAISSGTYDTSTIKSNSTTDNTNAPPDPPAITGMTGAWLVIACGGWRFDSSTANSVTPPTDYTEASELGTAIVDLSLATRTFTGLSDASEDPGAFVDSGSPTGTVAVTIGLEGV